MDKLEELALQVSPEAATRGVLLEKELLEILQNSQETPVLESFLIKLQSWGQWHY